MIDHVLGRPSVQFRKIQVLAVVSFWSLYLYRGKKHGPPVLRSLSRRLTVRLTAWQQLVITLLWLYVARNFGKLIGLECPEPLANLYTRSYFRATWFTTALDAGFWSAMRIRRKWLRDIASIIFSIYYLIAAEQADEKVRKVRGTLTVDHLRVSWNKATTPYLDLLNRLMRPKLTRYPPRAIRIPRPPESSYGEPVSAWLYFDGPLSALMDHRNVILDIPGGGFVAMDPRMNDDKLLAWAGRTGLPVLSLNYKKAPEYPYPYALNECYDVYHTLVASRGRCVGLSGEHQPKIVITGDSAGGNLATGVVLMILQSGSTDSRRWHDEKRLPTPEGLILVYPALDVNIGSWMTDEQMSLIRDKRMRKSNKMVLRRKSEDYNKLTPSTPHHSDDEEDDLTASPKRPLPERQSTLTDQGSTMVRSATPSTQPDASAAHSYLPSIAKQKTKVVDTKPQPLKTRLAMSSMISYFNDRILTPEMMRAMIILYVGPHNRPDFSTDFLLSPLVAPESLLAEFPPTYFQTGERDPLVDDTVIFAGRIRQAKHARWMERKEMGLLHGREAREFEEKQHVEVVLIPGISHGFLQFAGVFPEAWKYIYRCARWMEEIFARSAGSTVLTTTATFGDDDDYQHQPLMKRGGRHQAADVPTSPLSTAPPPDENEEPYHHLHEPRNNENKRHHRRLPTGESTTSGDDDRPLEMMMMTSTNSNTAPNGASTGKARPQNQHSPGLNPRDHRRRNRATTGPATTTTRARSSGAAGQRARRDADTDVDEDGDARFDTKQPRPPQQPKRSASSVSLATEGEEDDLLGRRMKGLAGGLMGMTTVGGE
ncbi:MAG: hypothetical protein M1816_003391 [Peltula sp. TS41687]|nr:MAG: hypothetical protein M1816_003391 [Peltula sp. TS41687]